MIGGPSNDPNATPEAALGRTRHFDPERLSFFSDAVMAIAITLLVVDLRVPELGPKPTDAALQAALRELVPGFFAFFLSFAVIAVWWNGHHRLFGALRIGDGRILLLNFVFLASVAFLPFPTAILGRYSDLTSAVMLYAATNVVIGLASYALWWHAHRARLLGPRLDEEEIQRRIGYGTIAPLVFGLSIPIALVDPTLATWSWNLVWIALVVWRAVRRRRHGRGPAAPASG
jgi:TMEM175 potassium channel family protein